MCALCSVNMEVLEEKVAVLETRCKQLCDINEHMSDALTKSRRRSSCSSAPAASRTVAYNKVRKL